MHVRMKEYLVLSLLLCALSSTARAAIAACTSPSNVPFPVDQTCAALQLTSNAQGCEALSLLGQLAADTQPLRCRSNACTGIRPPPEEDREGNKLPQPLPDARIPGVGLPSTLNYARQAEEEGGTYYWYFRNLLSLTNFAPCTLPTLGNADESELPAPHGWELVSLFDLRPPQATSETIPFAALLKRDHLYGYPQHERCRRSYPQNEAGFARVKVARSTKKADTQHYDPSQVTKKHTNKERTGDKTYDTTAPYQPGPTRYAEEPGLSNPHRWQYKTQDKDDYSQYNSPQHREQKQYYSPEHKQYKEDSTTDDAPYSKQYKKDSTTDDRYYKQYKEDSIIDDAPYYGQYKEDSTTDYQEHKQYKHADRKHKRHHHSATHNKPDAEKDERYKQYRPAADKDQQYKPDADKDERYKQYRPVADTDERYKQYRPAEDKDEHYKQYKSQDRYHSDEDKYSGGDEYHDSDKRDYSRDSYGRDHGDDYGREKDESPEVVILLRGTLTAAEWGLDVSYNQVSDPTFGPGKVSAGFYYAASTIWQSGLGAAVESEIDAGCRSITVAGYSMGGAVAQLLAVRIEALIAAADARDSDRYSGYEPDRESDYDKPAPVTVVTFGCPTTGDADWSANFNRKINARNIVFKGDFIPKFPCEPQIVGCPAIDQLPATNQSASWSYARPGAQIVIPGSAMPYTSTTNLRQNWSALETTSAAQLCNPQLLGAGAVVGHVCSYMCFTSQFVNDPSNLCWFDPYSVPAPGASLCSLACLRPNSLL